MTHQPRRRALALLIAASFASATFAADDNKATKEEAVKLNKVDVNATAPWRAKLNYIMREVDGPFITVTKKTSITKLDSIPTVIDNNLRGLFAQTPGLLVSEQQTPGQTNLSYRGIGNPQESEFVTVLQDGIPLEGDWIGYPTIYAFPLPQTIAEVQSIRGGSSLLYGPEPPPTINLISRKPDPDRELAGYTENVVGKDGLFATFNKVSGTVGTWDYLADAHYRTSDGQRKNGDSELSGADLHVGYRPDESAYWAADFHAYNLETGDPGKMSYSVFQNDEQTTTTPDARLWTERYVLSLTHDRHFDDKTELVAKVWTGYQDQASRSEAGFVAPQPPPTTAQLQDDQFRFMGLDARLVHRWSRGNAFTVGVTSYHSDAPFRQWTSPNLQVDRYDRHGSPCTTAAQVNCARLRQDRSTDYSAIFAENVFRWGQWHLVPSLRLEREKVDIDETIKPPTLTRDLVDRSVTHNVPLGGIGFGNDFGHLNESYFNVSQGWRPVRYFDVGSPFGNTAAGEINDPDPTHVLSFEAGVHGTPINGLFYDASLFQVNVKDRIESQPAGPGAPPNNTINVNTGDTRHRGFEGQIDYDFLAAQDPQTKRHFSVFANVSLLDAEFTATRNPANLGNKPAFSPRYLARAGLSWREDQQFKFALSWVSVGSQYFQDSNLAAFPTDPARFIPAKVPQHTIADLSGDFFVRPNVRLLAGVTNLTDRKYYGRVFSNGIEPGLGRSYYLGASYEF
ncbi:MAG: TonB-dependent receptor [Tahibacter sp.]